MHVGALHDDGHNIVQMVGRVQEIMLQKIYDQGCPLIDQADDLEALIELLKHHGGVYDPRIQKLRREINNRTYLYGAQPILDSPVTRLVRSLNQNANAAEGMSPYRYGIEALTTLSVLDNELNQQPNHHEEGYAKILNLLKSFV